MLRSAVALVAALAAAALLPVSAASAATVDVSISGLAFSPGSKTVNVGDTVRWTNSDPMAHTVTSDTGAFGSGNLAQSQQYSFTFNSPGTFNYHCALHLGMNASIVVQSAPPPPPPTFTVSGTVTGAGISGVSISVVGAVTRNALTAANGTYTVTDVPSGSYTVGPSKTGFTFSPESTPVTVSASVTGIDFVSSAVPPPPQLYSISGTITGPGAVGVVVSVTGPMSRSPVTGLPGTYLAANLSAGTYTVEPALPGYVFTPVSRSIDLSANAPDQDFLSSPADPGSDSLTVTSLKLKVSTKTSGRDGLALKALFLPDPGAPLPDPSEGDELRIQVGDFFLRVLPGGNLVAGKKGGQFAFKDSAVSLKLATIATPAGNAISIRFSIKKTSLQLLGPVDVRGSHLVTITFGPHEASDNS